MPSAILSGCLRPRHSSRDSCSASGGGPTPDGPTAWFRVGLLREASFPGSPISSFCPWHWRARRACWRWWPRRAHHRQRGAVLDRRRGTGAARRAGRPFLRSRMYSPSIARLARYGRGRFCEHDESLSTKLTSLAGASVCRSPHSPAPCCGRLTRTFALAWLVRHGGAQAVARWTHVPPA